MARKKRKSYNPFKMWGAWVGAYLLGFFISFFTVINKSHSDIFITAIEQSWFWLGELQPVIYTTTVSLYGFLIGWGIHSLFRRFRK